MPIARRAMLRLGAAAASLAAMRPLMTWADEGTLRMVVPFPAGGAADSNARVFGEALHAATGKTVVIDNKPGAGSIVGSLDLVRSRPDGGTFMWQTGGHTTNAVLMKKLPYDSVEDFTPITRLTRSPGFALVVGGKSPFRTLQEFLAAVRASPGKYSYGSAGNGSTPHVVAALFCQSAGINLLHVPYKGTPLVDLMSGTIDSSFVAPTLVAAYLKDGRLRALGISSPKRIPLLPETPSFNEVGVEGADIPAWSGLFGPPKMPPAVTQALYDDMMKAARSKMFEAYMKDQGNEVDGMPPVQFRAYVASEIERYKRVLPPLGIQMDS